MSTAPTHSQQWHNSHKVAEAVEKQIAVVQFPVYGRGVADLTLLGRGVGQDELLVSFTGCEGTIV